MPNVLDASAASKLSPKSVGKKKPKLALLCGGLLFRGYVEVFQGLLDSFEVTAFIWPETDLPLLDLKLTTKRVFSIESFLPSKFPLTRFLHRQVTKSVGSGFIPLFERQLKEFDILYTQEAYSAWTKQAIECKLRHGNRVVVQVIENLPFRREEEQCTLSAKTAAYKHADMFIAQTQQAADVCVLEGADRKKVQVVPLAVDTGMFRPAPKDPAILAELGCTHDDVIVLFTGRLLWVKGIIDLVQAASMLNSDDTCSHVKYLIVGDGPDRELMRKHIASYKLQNRFHFMHRVEYERMPAILNTADIVVVPSSISCSWEEQFGMVIAESMACAKPVITTNTGAIPEVVGDNAIIVPCHAPTQIASAICRLAHSREMRESLGDKGLAWARSMYSISTTSQKMLQCLEWSLPPRQVALQEEN